jgi:hypothetical protein
MPLLEGLYAYTVQGFMHAPKLGEPDNKKVYLHVPSFVKELEVNLANFGPAAYPNFQPKPAEAPPVVAGFSSPDVAVPPYQVATGYYPFSEVGFMLFRPARFKVASQTFPDNDGQVNGWRIVNTAGYPGKGSAFSGSYKFVGPAGAKPKDFQDVKDIYQGIGDYAGPVPTLGVITTQFPNKLNHVWDYVFVLVSDEEIQLTTNGRLPRPGAATGRMRRTRPA